MTTTPRVIPPPTWTPGKAEYHADPAWSSSRLKDFRASPALAYWRYVHEPADERLPPREAKHLDMGNVIEELLYHGPDQLPPSVKLADTQDRRPKKYKELAEQFPNHTILTIPELAAATEACKSVWEPRTKAAQLARRLLLEVPGYREYAVRWTYQDADGDYGLELKAMADRIVETPLGIARVEIKTTGRDPLIGDARVGGTFGRQAWDLEYHVQSALYRMGLRVALRVADPEARADYLAYREEFGRRPSMGEDLLEPLNLFVVVSTSPPHEVTVWRPSAELMERGEIEVMHTLDDIAACVRGRRPWCSAAEEMADGRIPELTAPPWAWKE